MRKETLEEHNKDLQRIRELTIVIDVKQEFVRELLQHRRDAKNRVRVREKRKK